MELSIAVCGAFKRSCVCARSARKTLCHRDHRSINLSQTETTVHVWHMWGGTYTATKGCGQCAIQMVTMEARRSWPFRVCGYNVIHQLIIVCVRYCKECVNRMLKCRRLTTLIVQPAAKARITEGASWVAFIILKQSDHTGKERNSILVRGSSLSVDSSSS